MTNIRKSKMPVLAGMALLSVSLPKAWGGDLCSLPVGGCSGAGCSFRQGSFKPLGTFQVKTLPFKRDLPSDACVEGDNKTLTVSGLPLKSGKDIKGQAASSAEIGIVGQVLKIPSEVTLTYRAWIETTPPNCSSAFGSASPGEKLMTWSQPNAKSGDSCAAHLTTSICDSDGTGKFDITPQAFKSCSE